MQSCCVLCSNGCALDIGVKEGKIVGVRGRAEDRVNHGRLGPKGLHGWAGQQQPRPAHSPAHPRRRRLPPGHLGRGDGPDRRAAREAFATGTPRGAIGFYNTGQIFLEEYYTLSVIAQAGLGTSNIDGNTRLCTATAAQALCETFGTDGQPGSYADFDMTDCILLVGHNMAETQTVLWARVLDRRRGPNAAASSSSSTRGRPRRPRRPTSTWPRASAPTSRVLNGLMHLLIKAGQIDREFIDQHTVGFDDTGARSSRRYPPERVREITGVPAAKLRAAAAIARQCRRRWSPPSCRAFISRTRRRRRPAR